MKTGELAALGLDDSAERIYELLLDRPSAALDDIAEACALSRPAAQRALGGLEARGLVARAATKERRYLAQPPEAALELLLIRRHEELERVRVRTQSMAERFRRARPQIEAAELVELVVGREGVVQRFQAIVSSAKREILSFERPPYTAPSAAPSAQEVESLAKGVRHRVLYSEEALAIPGKLEHHIEPAMAAGEEARFLRALPTKLVVADRRIAITPLRLDEPGIAIVLHESPLLESVALLFDELWERAQPLHVSAGRGDTVSVGVRDRPSELDQRLLVLLVAGFKDRSIAQQLGIGHATVERHIRKLMDDLGVQTRFQLGYQAGLLGWLPADW